MIYSQDPATEEYIKLIREVIIAMPGERIGIEETQKRIKEIIRKEEPKEEVKEEDVIINIDTNEPTSSTKEEAKTDHPEDKQERI